MADESKIIGMDNDPNSIAHHGIKNQKWGVQNGPPYPLSEKLHNKVVKKAKKAEKSKTSKTKESSDDSKTVYGSTSKKSASVRKARKARLKNEADKKKINKKRAARLKKSREEKAKKEELKKKYAKDPKLLKKHSDLFTNEELENALTRFEIQKDIDSVNPKKKTELTRRQKILSKNARTLERYSDKFSPEELDIAMANIDRKNSLKEKSIREQSLVSKRYRNVVLPKLQNVSDTAYLASNTLESLANARDARDRLSPNRLNSRERHKIELYKRANRDPNFARALGIQTDATISEDRQKYIDRTVADYKKAISDPDFARALGIETPNAANVKQGQIGNLLTSIYSQREELEKRGYSPERYINDLFKAGVLGNGGGAGQNFRKKKNGGGGGQRYKVVSNRQNQNESNKGNGGRRKYDKNHHGRENRSHQNGQPSPKNGQSNNPVGVAKPAISSLGTKNAKTKYISDRYWDKQSNANVSNRYWDAQTNSSGTSSKSSYNYYDDAVNADMNDAFNRYSGSKKKKWYSKRKK